MKVLPNVTVLVIGHADQRGSDLANYKLSADRATAVVNYLVGDGVQANRLSSRAVGEADLLTLDGDATALALNRRTEFVFYGLLVQ
jgi:outer membrane protein OmpA-like peptidoglycan-associated protein